MLRIELNSDRNIVSTKHNLIAYGTIQPVQNISMPYHILLIKGETHITFLLSSHTQSLSLSLHNRPFSLPLKNGSHSGEAQE